jgi:hypothetical protein
VRRLGETAFVVLLAVLLAISVLPALGSASAKVPTSVVSTSLPAPVRPISGTPYHAPSVANASQLFGGRQSAGPTIPASTAQELDLLGGQNDISSSLVYEGFSNQTNTSYPVLLNQTASNAFWSFNESVLLLAPKLTTDHDAGAVFFAGTTNQTETVSAIGSMISHTSGDGFEAYLGVDLTSSSNWNSQYFATYPEWTQGNTAPCQGSVIFPYSSTPYVVVQWEPAYLHSSCNVYTSYSGEFNIYLVSPSSNVVTKSQIVTYPGLGGADSESLLPDDLMNFTVSYSSASDAVEASVTDLVNPGIVEQAVLNLPSGFTFGGSLGSSTYYGLGGSGNAGAAWALLSATLTLGGVPPVLPGYFVSFDATQNPTQTPPWFGGVWDVSLNGSLRDSYGNVITYVEPNGTYSWKLLGSVYQYTPVPANGTIDVDGSSLTDSITYWGSSPTIYESEFTETGLPSGTSWSVSIDSTLPASNSASLLVPLISGTYSYVVVPTAGYSPNPSSGQIVVNGANPSAVPIVFSALPMPTFNATVITQPTTCTIEFDGRTVGSGSIQQNVAAGGHTITALECTGLAFAGWTSTVGPLTSAGSYQSSVDVVANGTLTATYATPSSPIVSSFLASPSTITLGGATQISLSATGGRPPYLLEYSGLPSGCSSIDSQSFSCVPSSSGVYELEVEVTDAYGLEVTAVTLLTVSPASPSSLTLSSLSVSPSSVPAGSAATLSSSVSGGSPPYTYQYTGLPPGSCSHTTQPSIVCTPTAAGTYLIGLHVTDSASKIASGSVVLTVTSMNSHAGPTLTSFSIAPSSVALGGPITVSFVSSGWTGTPSFTYSGLPPGCTSPDASTFECTPSLSGTYAVTALATGSGGSSLTGTANLQVTSAIGLSVSSFYATPSVVTENQPIAFEVSVSGGVSPYEFHYVAYGNGNICGSGVSQLSNSFTCSTVGMQGSFQMSVYVSDQNYAVSSVVWVSFTVTALTGNWLSSPTFSVGTASITGAAVCAGIQGFNPVQSAACASLQTLFHGDPSAGATIYTIQPTSLSPSALAAYDASLESYFGMAPPSPYSAALTLLIHVPLIEDANDLFGTNIPTYLGAPVDVSLPGGFGIQGFNPELVLTANGAVNVAFTLSYTNPLATFSSQVQLSEDLVTLLSDSLEPILKQTPQSMVTLLSDGAGLFLDVADVTVRSVSSDLTQSGPLSSLPFFDLSTFYQGPWKSAVAPILQQLDLVTLCGEVAASGAGDLPSDLQCPLTAINDAVDLLPSALPGANLGSNTAYNLVSTGLGTITSIVDPPNATILPTIRNATGSVVLGYNPSTGTFVSSSSDGLLIYMGEEVSLHLATSKHSTLYKLEFTEVGNLTKGVYLPYSGQMFTGAKFGGNYSAGLAGILFNASSTTVSFHDKQSANVTFGTTLAPTVSALWNNKTGFAITISSVTSTGHSVDPTACLIVSSGISIPLTVKGNSCSGTLNSSVASKTIAGYVYSASYAGGYVQIDVPPARFAVVFNQSGNPKADAWEVSLGGILETTTNHHTLAFNEPNGTYPYVISGPSGYRISGLPAAGNITVEGTNITANGVTLAPFHFVKGKTGAIVFRVSGLLAGTSWCVVVGWKMCYTGTTIAVENLTPGFYPYTISPVSGYAANATLSGQSVGLSGWLDISTKTSTLVVAYVAD